MSTNISGYMSILLNSIEVPSHGFKVLLAEKQEHPELRIKSEQMNANIKHILNNIDTDTSTISLFLCFIGTINIV